MVIIEDMEQIKANISSLRINFLESLKSIVDQKMETISIVTCHMHDRDDLIDPI